MEQDTLYGTPFGARWWSPRAQGTWPGGGQGVPSGSMRVSDAERSKVAEDLSKHYADGRLDETEFNERMTKAMSAKTRDDLSGLLTDLPRLDLPEPVARPVRPHRTGSRIVGIAIMTLVVLSIASAISWNLHFPIFLFFIIGLVIWRKYHRHLHRWHGGHGPGMHGPSARKGAGTPSAAADPWHPGYGGAWPTA